MFIRKILGMRDKEHQRDSDSYGSISVSVRNLLSDYSHRSEPSAYDLLSEFEKAQFNRQKREQFDVSKKRRRLRTISLLRERRYAFQPDIPKESA